MPLIRHGDDGRNRECSELRIPDPDGEPTRKPDEFTPIIAPLIKIEIAAYGRKPPWTTSRRLYL